MKTGSALKTDKENKRGRGGVLKGFQEKKKNLFLVAVGLSLDAQWSLQRFCSIPSSVKDSGLCLGMPQRDL